MDKEVLTDALSTCLTSLETFISIAVLIAIAVIWPAIRHKDKIEVVSLSAERRNAYPLVATIYVFINTAALILFLRLAFLVRLLDDSDGSKKALDTVATHGWILNPYSYFGSSVDALVYASTTYGLLIVVWWFCFASLHVLAEEPKQKYQSIFERALLGIGLAAMMAMGWAGFEMLAEIDSDVPEYNGVVLVLCGKGVMSFISIGFGCGVFAICNWLKKSYAPSADNNANSTTKTETSEQVTVPDDDAPREEPA